MLSLDQPWRLSPQVALRPEPFGALAYHYGNRRLTFLKTPTLVRLVRDLADHPSLATALAAHVPADHRDAYLRALDQLAAADVVRPGSRDDGVSDDGSATCG